MTDKKVICITGLDGVGKSTLVDTLVEQLPGSQAVNIWDLLDSSVQSLPFQSKRQIDDFLCALSPDSRLLFLAHALKYAVDKALQSDAKILIMNSYFYKYFATEKALGANSELIDALAKSFPTPDITLQLVLPVEEAVTRKKVLSRYECGLEESPNQTAFVDFQNRVNQLWATFDSADWHLLDARKTPAELLAETLQII